ncbi:glycosyltransferase [Actinoplanes sp. NEAU-A12]|uniref:Glycosyltransferase n=1 Tax=Actinoplanes sandaracinus TaxID=3045177 RepID=A0ABT6WRC1_9ACTN|nr:glycosyltransferase [Actinoplanes sandaracinus]MDI6102279.1 glycosyltransferase [Actinoplanes sandaracinus]
MSLTLGCMVRNERNHLPRLLEAATAHPDVIAEILILDTGSTDDTVALAEAAGARVLHLPGPLQRFDEARNHLLGNVTTDWLLFLDADEVPSEDMFDAVHRISQRPTGPPAVSFPRYNFFANGSFYLSTECKLLRLTARPTYSGAVAESVLPSLPEPPTETPAVLYHFGHTRPLAARIAKAEWYLDLMRRELASGSPRAGIARAAALIERSLGHFPAARDLVDQAIRLGGQNSRTDFVLGHVRRGEPGEWPARAEFEQALSQAPDDPAIVNLAAVTRLCDNDPAGARTLLAAAVRRWPHLPHLRLNLGLTLAALGRNAEALGHLDAVAAAHPAFRTETFAGRLEFDPWRSLMSETIPGYAGLDLHRAYLRELTSR